jgi:pSer/pThr/pTyr-binding forkhead associated (FHA) protein
MPVCPHCGHDNAEAGARFCANCGRSLAEPASVDATSSLTLRDVETPEPAELTADEAEDAALAARLEPGTAMLVVHQGPASGARFLLDDELTTVGRHPDSHIFFDDVTVSRRHAEFHRDGDSFRIHDVGSLNGTYVNRKRIDDVVLYSGDKVQIGKYRLVFLAPSEGDSQ